jgi:hypothetical protein
MGGKSFNRAQIDREHYLDIEADIRGYPDQYLGGDRHHILRYHGNKPDFGDVVFMLHQLSNSDNPTTKQTKRITLAVE